MYKCIVHMRPRGDRAMNLLVFRLGFSSGVCVCVCVFSVWVREMWVRVSCAVVCMALTVHEHRVYTLDRSVLPPHLTSRISRSS